MGRGLSDQQRRILALAKAVNAAIRGGVPAPQSFAIEVRPGVVDVLPGQWRPAQKRRYVVPLAFAAETPDFCAGLALVELFGFRVERGDWYWHWSRYRPSRDERRKRHVSLGRALDSLVDRGLLVHAMDPSDAECFLPAEVVANLCDYRRARGDESFGKFWSRQHGSGWVRAYWLTPQGHDAAPETWSDYDAAELLTTYSTAWLVRRDVQRGYWWESSETDSRKTVDAAPLEPDLACDVSARTVEVV